MTPRPRVQVEGLAHRFDGPWHLEVPRLTLGPGLHELRGPNGAGKSTLLRILATLLTPRRGRVHIAGHRLDTAPERARAHLGYAGHRPLLHDVFTASENLSLHARLHGLAADRVDTALETWGLQEEASRSTAALSHGQRRRLDLARATLHEPPVLLLDEPHEGLDAASRETLERFLEDGSDRAVLVATHGASPGEPDTVLQMERGRLTGEDLP